MNQNLENKMRRVTYKALDKILKKQFPKVNISKIVDFYIKFLKILLQITGALVMLFIFTYYLPNTYDLKSEQIMVILLIIIILTLRGEKSE